MWEVKITNNDTDDSRFVTFERLTELCGEDVRSSARTAPLLLQKTVTNGRLSSPESLKRALNTVKSRAGTSKSPRPHGKMPCDWPPRIVVEKYIWFAM